MRRILLPAILALLVSSEILATPKKAPHAPPRPPSAAQFAPVQSLWARISSFFRRFRPSCDQHSTPPPCPGTPSSGG